ncbi:MAG TPA: class A beta-lactamase [Pyrinomonadaceae bacterium]|nr:class A beta-lactamase [Pyrinomonadaceae bacterium]
MKLVLSFLVGLSIASGCASRGVSEAPRAKGDGQPEVSSSKFQVSSPASEALKNQINEIAAAAKGKVGVTAVALESGETLASLNPHEHFPMQSVYKLPISMAVMQGVDAGKLKLGDKILVSKSEMVGRRAHSPIRDRHPNGTSLTVEALLRYALAESDGTASDVLMRLAGGPAAVQAYLTGLGIKDMIVLDTEQTFSQNNTAQYRNWATPEASVALVRALHERRGLSESSQGLLLKFMTESKPGQKRLKGLLPAGTAVAHKTGTSGTEKGVTAATNDIGIITLPTGRRVAIAVFVSDSPADEATREGVIAKIAKAVFDASK